MSITKIQSLITKINPKPVFFNPSRVAYEIGNVSMYADAGKGSVYLAKNGSILVKDMKRLGICTLGSDIWKAQRIFVKNSDLTSNVAKREKDVVKLVNCNLPKQPPKPPKYVPIVDIVFTNRT